MERKKTIVCCALLFLISVIWIQYSTRFNSSNKECCPPYANWSSFRNPPPFAMNPLNKIRTDCGELCDISRKGVSGMFFDEIKASVDCKALFKNEFIDRGHDLPKAPKEMPAELRNEYTMNNRLRIKPWYFDEKYLGGNAYLPLWKQTEIDKWVSLARQGRLKGNYGIQETNFLRDGLKHAPEIKQGRVLVIGSQTPWVEACVLEAGAREVVTLEYGQIISQHPKVKTMVPYDFRMSFLNKTLGSFDAIVTFSSIEHSGLGRYGDALNPWGDIIAIARAWCVTKPGGSLTLGVPYVNSGVDYIAFNAGRFYGKIRYPYLATNWRQIYRGKGGMHRVHVFSKVK